MISTILVGLVTMPAAPPTPVYRTDKFWLSDSFESKAGDYVNATDAEHRHTLTLTFALTNPPYSGASAVETKYSVRTPNAFGWGDPDYVDAGFDPWLANVAPSGTWLHGSSNLQGAVGGVTSIKFAYHNIVSDKLEGGTTFEVVYRWKGTVSSVVKTWVYHMVLKVYKVEANGDAPIDSRLAYGTQNDAWTTIDANGELRNLNFNPWIYHGGLFVGNMAFRTRDRSGTARTQLWFPEITEEDEDDLDNLQFAHASLMSLGFWPSPASSSTTTGSDFQPWRSMDIGLWVPESVSETESTAKWSNRWGPSQTAGSGYLAYKSFDQWLSGSQREYANWPIMTTLNSSSAVVNSTALRKFLLAAKDEGDLLSGDGKARWRYFAGKDMGAIKHPGGDNTGLPVSDQKPRIWVICTRVGEVYEYTGPDMPEGDPIGGTQ